MYLFSRTRLVNPARLRDALAWGAGITGFVNDKTDLQFSMWTVNFGAPLGTVLWSARADSQAQMSGVARTLMSDDAYLQQVEESAPLFIGPAQDRLGQVVHAVNLSETVKPVAVLIVAECAAGRLADAMTWGVSITDYVGTRLGTSGMFLKASYGPFLGVSWITTVDSMEEVDAGDGNLAADPEYLRRLDEAGPLFQPNVERFLLQKVA